MPRQDLCIGNFGNQRGFPELVSTGRPFEVSSDGLEYLFPDPFADQGPSDDWRSRETLSVAKLVLSPERGYAPAFVERGNWYGGGYRPSVRISSIEGKMIDGVWVPMVIEVSRHRGELTDGTWKVLKRMYFDPSSFVFVDEFQEGDFAVEFPDESHYVDHRTGERVGTPPAMGHASSDAKSMSRSMIALLAAFASLVTLLLLVLLWKKRHRSHGF